MSKVDSPLYGTDASGSIAGTIAFSNQWGWTIARGHAQPADVKTPLRLYQRGRFLQASQLWQSLAPFEQAAWRARTSGMLTGYNLFIQAYFFGIPVEELPLTAALYGQVIFAELLYGQEGT